MKFNQYRFDDITLNFDKHRIPLSARQREKRKGIYRYYGAQGIIDYVDDYLFNGEYLLIAEDGENLKSNKQSIAQIVTGQFWVNNHAHIIQTNEQCNLQYLCYLINTIDLSGYITGSAQPKLSQSNLNAIKLNLPERKQQDKIVSFLNLLDRKIELNNAINNNLEQQAFAIFDDIFHSLFEGTSSVGDYIIPKRGKNLLSKNAVPGEVPVVAGGLNPAIYHNVANTIAPVLTISASGANSGYVALWHKPVWSSDSSYIDSSMSDAVYFWYVLLKKRQKEIYDSQTGSAQPHIYPQHIAALPTSNIERVLIADYVAKVSPMFRMVGANTEENLWLSSLRDTLLPKLMSGKLDVSNVNF